MTGGLEMDCMCLQQACEASLSARLWRHGPWYDHLGDESVIAALSESRQGGKRSQAADLG